MTTLSAGQSLPGSAGILWYCVRRFGVNDDAAAAWMCWQDNRQQACLLPDRCVSHSCLHGLHHSYTLERGALWSISLRVTGMSYGLVCQTLSLLEEPGRRMFTDGLGKATQQLLFYWFSQKSVGARIKYLGRKARRAETQCVVFLLGGQLSFIACRTGAALSLHRRRGWGTHYGWNPQIHSGVTALDNTTRVAVCSHLLRADCTEQIELCKTSNTGRILTLEKSGRIIEQNAQKGTAADFHPKAATQATLKLFLGTWNAGAPIYS